MKRQRKRGRFSHMCDLCQEYRKLDRQLRIAWTSRTLTRELLYRLATQTCYLWAIPHIRTFQKRPFFYIVSTQMNVPLPDEIEPLFHEPFFHERKGTGHNGE